MIIFILMAWTERRSWVSILKTKSFILDNAEIEESYKERIRKYYLSPKEILKLVNEKEEAERKEE